MALDKDEFSKLTTALFYAEKVSLGGTPYIQLDVVMNILSAYSEELRANIICSTNAKGQDVWNLTWKSKNE